jgi:hypothetical protein
MDLIWIETLGCPSWTNARLLQAAARVEPVVIVHYNYTKNKLLQELFGRFEDLAPNHSYFDFVLDSFSLMLSIFNSSFSADLSNEFWFCICLRNVAVFVSFSKF